MDSLKLYVNDLMNDRKFDTLSQFIKSILLIISYIYGFLVKGHYFFYKINLLKSYKSKASVISIGNITLGGTGKTPFVIMIAEHPTLKNRKNTAVLIRGYGEDEWKILEDRLGKHGIRVLVGRDRVKTAKEAENHDIDNVILDDGFQHRRLKRDLDIVLIDSTNPFGNRCLFPRGILREPLLGLKRASAFVLTKTDKGRENIAAIEDEIKKIAPGKQILKSFHRPTKLTSLTENNIKELSFTKDKKVCIVSAICDPSYFKYTVEKAGACVDLEFIFPDHYLYKVRDLERIFKECKANNIGIIITTEKDAVKLKRLNMVERYCQIFTLNIELEITEGKEALDDIFSSGLHMRYSR